MLSRNENDCLAIYHLVMVQVKQSKLRDGVQLIEHGLALKAYSAPLWFAQAELQKMLGRNEDSLKSYNQVITLDPNHRSALVNYAALLHTMNRHHEALVRLEQLIVQDPDNENALCNSGIVLTEYNRGDLAIPRFRRLMELNPDYAYVPGLLCYELLRLCYWDEVPELCTKIIEGVRAGKRICKSLAFMAISDQAEDQFLAARIFSARFPRQEKPLWNRETYNHKRLRLAYLSPDLREHPVGHLIAGVFERHDKSRFEVFGISNGVNDGSRLLERIRNSCDHFIDVMGQAPQQIAEMLRANEIDIAIDLAGYTSRSCIDVLAYRPAPLQATYLGYSGTLGNDYIDYIFADRHVIPPEHQQFFSEKVAYLPNSFMPTDSGIQLPDRIPTRLEYGLPEKGLILCAFSHDYKINPKIFDVWMRILSKFPESTIWLASRNEFSQINLRREAKIRGVDPSRLVFATRVPKVEDHLARYRLVDLFLDTLPYNAHVTSADALFAGVPVLTCMGNAFPARVAGSLLHAIGLQELITHSLEEYEALAIDLLSNPQRLIDLKAKLAANKTTYPLFNTDQFCTDFENMLVSLYANHQFNAGHLQKTPEVLQPKPISASKPISPSMPVLPPASSSIPTTPLGKRLNIGGKSSSPGWENFNNLGGSGIDHVGNPNDLSRFAENTFEILYASHVLQRFDYKDELEKVLSQWYRVLIPGCLFMVSVPDLEVLAELLLDKKVSMPERLMVMRMIFGGHMDETDYHSVGLTVDLLTFFLQQAGFVDIKRVESFGLFRDASDLIYLGRRISLNVLATKPVSEISVPVEPA
ncbi:MAG: methyltransferase domain-containing protein [Candidatus Riflebacteria bacterium]|nr:methyltransferase domain-containing protein [Candidatus Riflebacteria bacterium]